MNWWYVPIALLIIPFIVHYFMDKGWSGIGDAIIEGFIIAATYAICWAAAIAFTIAKLL